MITDALSCLICAKLSVQFDALPKPSWTKRLVVGIRVVSAAGGEMDHNSEKVPVSAELRCVCEI